MTPLANSIGWLTGYLPDLPTPFDQAGHIDLACFAKLCERQIRAGVAAIVAGETTGEASTLTPAEHDAIVRTAVEIANGRVRVIAGAGSNSTSQAIELTRRAELAGADAVLSVVPYYNKPMQAGIAAHFRAIADSTRLPIILHDIPARTIRELSDDTLAKLAQSRQFIALRDATGDLARPIRLRSMVPSGFRLLSGDDTTALAFLANGGDGCISVVSNVAPELCQAIFSSCRQGRLQSARYLQSRLARLAALLARENPAALKYAMGLLGLMRPDTRLPIVELAETAKAEVESALAEMGEEDLASEGWEDVRSQTDAAAT
ncbi:MAG: 4-hydroxy-tetrahydrodipicolinate synthase [Bradyrhizobium sp.]|uniref:4-hydroxy-tetrahydrodipicolinate synthase n=1 Tax=Bradyrhizobium sp. TaxID=376 RepID=UPI0012269BC9|nr:4-hydroxy-tetrahydrodipicolinate synthase [Bradyrhizobium sp.]THD47943.1 MAG: 4-hydroxy-tetrahydrodipicolinate synthase [Bradyrhizobium sp.]